MSEKPDAVGTAAVEDLTFEAALAELERVVAALEQGDVPLEESIALYGRGAALRQHCQKKLEEAEQRVSQITEGADGRIGAKPVEIG